MRWAHTGTDSRTDWQTPYRFIDLLRIPHANNEIYGHKPTHPPEWWAGYHGERTVLYKEQGMRRRTYRSDQRSCTPAIVHKAYRNEKANVQIGSAILYSGYCTQSTQEWEDKCTDRISNLVLRLLHTKHTGMRRRTYRSDQRSCTPDIVHKAHRFIWLEFTSERSD